MGYNQYGHFHINATSKDIRSLADGLVTSGLRDAGYRLIQIDDSWTNIGPRTNDNIPLQPNGNFSDIVQLSKDLHSKGFLFGKHGHPMIFGIDTGTNPIPSSVRNVVDSKVI